MPRIDILSPTVHMNGDTRETLFAVNVDAIVALDAAIDAMVKAAPHPRNFYVQGDDAFSRARREHEARLKVLSRVREEYTQIAQDIGVIASMRE